MRGGGAAGAWKNDMRGSIHGRSAVGCGKPAERALVFVLCAAGLLGWLEGALGSARWEPERAGKGTGRRRGAPGGKSGLGHIPGEGLVNVVDDGEDGGRSGVRREYDENVLGFTK